LLERGWGLFDRPARVYAALNPQRFERLAAVAVRCSAAVSNRGLSDWRAAAWLLEYTALPEYGRVMRAVSRKLDKWR